MGMTQDSYTGLKSIFDTFTDVRTIFEITEHDFSESEIEVRRNEKAFVHNFRYQGEAILQSDYTDERDKVFPAGIKLFKIEVKNFNAVYCGTIEINNIIETNLKIRCFFDVDEDGLFDAVRPGIVSFVDPVSVNTIRNSEDTKPKQLSYTIVSHEDRKDIGKLWFGIRNKRQKPNGLGLYAGTEEYDQFMYATFIGGKTGATLEFKGASVEVTGVKKRKTKLRINKAIEEGVAFELYSKVNSGLISHPISRIE